MTLLCCRIWVNTFCAFTRQTEERAADVNDMTCRFVKRSKVIL